MDLTVCSETSAKLNLTPGKYPKQNIQDSEHGEKFENKNISKTAFLDGMKKLKERANKCIDQGGMYFEE
jgi:hypothetical protein